MSAKLTSLIAVFALAIGLAPSVTEAQSKDRLDRRDKLLGWESVGRLDTRFGQCTGVLIDRDVVLTAAHCVARNGAPMAPAGMVFRAGYRDGQEIAARRVELLTMPDTYNDVAARGNSAASVALDVALLKLETPIFEPGADPVGFAGTPRVGTSLTMASYGAGRSEALTLEQGCALQGRFQGGVISFDCDATFGSSGAPVFAEVAGRLRIVSIVSAGTVQEDGRKVIYGMDLASIVPDLRRALNNQVFRTPVSEGPRRIGVGERSSTGARFVRPGG